MFPPGVEVSGGGPVISAISSKMASEEVSLALPALAIFAMANLILASEVTLSHNPAASGPTNSPS